MSVTFSIDNIIRIQLKLSLEKAKLKYHRECVYEQISKDLFSNI